MPCLPWSSWPHGLTSTPGLASFAGLGIPRKREIQVYSLNWAETEKNNHVNKVYSERETDPLTLTSQFGSDGGFGLVVCCIHDCTDSVFLTLAMKHTVTKDSMRISLL